ncbi:hypothetical protein Tco_0746850 [Tanacetum coccineum]
MVLNSPCFTVKSWLVQDQTVPVQKQKVFGKDKSNPLIVDSLLKTIRFSIHLVVYNEELAIPEQTATGKGISNPLMAELRQLEQAANVSTHTLEPSRHFNSTYYDDDDDDDEESTIPLNEIISQLPQSMAITPVLPTMEPEDSLIMEDEHLRTIPEKESDEFIKSSVEDLVPIPSESEDLSEDLSDIESECDMPFCDDFTTFFNPLFDSNDDFTSSDDESLSDEDVLEENFKIYSNPLFDEEIISTKIDPHHFNAESDLLESLLNRDTSIVSSSMFDSLLEEFSGKLAHINLISPEIDETDFDPEEEIHLVEKLLYDNSSPRPPKKLNYENYDVVIKSFSPYSIPVEDSKMDLGKVQ